MAFYIYDLIADDAWNYLIINVGWDNNYNLPVQWYPNSLVGTYYSLGGAIYLLGGDRWDSDVILHEYSHFVMYKIYTIYPPTPNCSNHSWGIPSSEGCAWTEGWATFLQAAVQNDKYYDDTEDISVHIDLELPNPPALGADVEGAVTASLWDIFDTETEVWDKLSSGINGTSSNGIWNIVYGTDPTTAKGFETNWITSYNGFSCDVIGIFSHHTIGSGSCAYTLDLRNQNGWSSKLIIRNNGAGPSAVKISSFNSAGSLLCFATNLQLASQATWEWSLCATDGTSAIVAADQDVSVIVARYKASPSYLSASYTGISNPATTAYLPVIQGNNGGWYSDVIVMNTGSSTASITVNFQRQDQSGDICTQTLSRPANGSITLSTFNIPCLGSGFVGSARVSSSQPLAVIGTQWKDYTGDGVADALADYEGMSATGTTNYFPFLLRDFSNWRSGLSLQNPGTANSITLDFYNASGGGCGQTIATIPQNSVKGYYPLPVTCPTPFYGSGKAIGSQTLVSIVNHTYTLDRDVSSSGVRGGNTQAVAIPLALKNATYLGRSGWNTGLSIKNTGSGTATATIKFYNSTGTLVSTTTSSIPASAISILSPLPGVPDGFIGSVWVSADRTIAVSATHSISGTSGDDSAMAYLGINR
jgi:hypothetical protein